MGVSPSPQCKLRVTKYGVYYIKFRVALSLQPYFNRTYISKTLSTKSKREAQSNAIRIRIKYLDIVRVGHLLDASSLQAIVDKFINETLHQNKSLPHSTKLLAIPFTINDAFKSYSKWYEKTNIQPRQYKTVTNRLRVAIYYFGASRVITELTTEDIEEYVEFLTRFPNTNKQPYCKMTFKEISNLKSIPSNDLISNATLIKYIKAFRQMENYLVDDGKLDRKISKRVILPTATTESILPFSVDDLSILFNLFITLDDRKLIYYVFAYTGMRTSEFWKCKIGIEKGVYYFDLSYKGVELKTSSSRRKIPIHSKLLDMGIAESLEILQKSFSKYSISLEFNTKIIDHIKNRKNKVMYSFRHTVATELKRANVEMDKVSEILGHSYENNTITKSTYAGKYSLCQLRDAVENLVY